MDYYLTDFGDVKAACRPSPHAKKIIDYLRGKAILILATNPLFPRVATHERIKWAGLEPEDFQLITTYEDNRHSKPHLRVLSDILRRINLPAEECLMVGNDAKEDMVAGNWGWGRICLPIA